MKIQRGDDQEMTLDGRDKKEKGDVGQGERLVNSKRKAMKKEDSKLNIASPMSSMADEEVLNTPAGYIRDNMLTPMSTTPAMSKPTWRAQPEGNNKRNDENSSPL